MRRKILNVHRFESLMNFVYKLCAITRMGKEKRARVHDSLWMESFQIYREQRIKGLREIVALSLLNNGTMLRVSQAALLSFVSHASSVFLHLYLSALRCRTSNSWLDKMERTGLKR
jgi:hypothetical protein